MLERDRNRGQGRGGRSADEGQKRLQQRGKGGESNDEPNDANDARQRRANDADHLPDVPEPTNKPLPNISKRSALSHHLPANAHQHNR